LMTPLLRKTFGALTVRKTQDQPNDDTVLRRSSIYQASTDIKILDAELRISVQALPAGFIVQLQNENRLFGQLLQDFAIPVRIAERELYQTTDKDSDTPRWGRRVTLYHSDTKGFICKVDELLVEDDRLLPLLLTAHVASTAP
ncbi:MAG: hypothetical protein WCO04_15065, partial [Pseudomonadota bacterium]